MAKKPVTKISNRQVLDHTINSAKIEGIELKEKDLKRLEQILMESNSIDKLTKSKIK